MWYSFHTELYCVDLVHKCHLFCDTYAKQKCSCLVVQIEWSTPVTILCRRIFIYIFLTRVQYRSCAEQCELSGVQQWSLLCAGGGGRTEGSHPQQLPADSQEGARPHLAAPAGHWGAQGTAGEPQWYEGQWCWFTLLFFFFSCVLLLLPDCSNQPW